MYDPRTLKNHTISINEGERIMTIKMEILKEKQMTIKMEILKEKQIGTENRGGTEWPVELRLKKYTEDNQVTYKVTYTIQTLFSGSHESNGHDFESLQEAEEYFNQVVFESEEVEEEEDFEEEDFES
jgi:hypothetical protein